jgi:hypothetical protein
VASICLGSDIVYSTKTLTSATMDEMPKVRLSAAIFRRGGEKKELFGQTHEEDISDEQVMAEKMAMLESVWSAPRIG